MKLERRGSFGWPATAAASAPCRNGLVAHYDGSDQGLADKPHSACRTYWRNTREFHMRAKSRGGRGWQDIGYSFAVCPHGIVMEGRGWQREQAAQPGGNTTWTSCTFMGGEHEKPTAAQVNAFRELRAWLRGKGLAAAISYHGRFIETTCPGGILRQMVTSGALAGAPSKEGDMDPDTRVQIPDYFDAQFSQDNYSAAFLWAGSVAEVRKLKAEMDARLAAQDLKLDQILAALTPKEV